MEQVISFSSALPIKKRRFPITESASSSEENPSISEDNKQESCVRTDATEISDLSKSSALEVIGSKVDISESTPLNAKPIISVGPFGNLNNKVDTSSAKESAGQEVLTSGTGCGTVNVKQGIVNGETEGTLTPEPSAGLKTADLPLESKELVVHALEQSNGEVICGKLEKTDSFLLSLGVSKGKLGSSDNNDVTVKTASMQAYANRSNWDLNTSMDEWEGSAVNDAFSHRSIGFGGFSKISNGHGVKSSLGDHDRKSADGTVSLSLDKGKRTLNVSCSRASGLPVKQCKPGDSLGLSLAMPLREMGAVGNHSFLSEKLDSTDGQKLKLQKIHLSHMNLASSRTVKLEPVAEDLKSDSSVDINSSNMGLSKFISLKREVMEKRSSEFVFMSSISPKKLVDYRSIKSESLQDCNNELCLFEDSVRPQHNRRVIQHQESTASSSGLSTPLTPQNSCLSRFPAESNIMRDQSLNSLHSRELFSLKDTPNEHIAATVSKSLIQESKQSMLRDTGNMNVEVPVKLEHTRVDGHPLNIGRNTHIPANYEEKINLSTEMLEESALGSDCQSNENHGVTPMIGGERPSNKEDREYEEGEVRTPLQQSAGAGSIVDEKKTGNVELVEHESRHLRPLVLFGDQSTNAWDNDVKSTISEKYDEILDDHIKECVVTGGPNHEEYSSHKLSDSVPEAGVEEKRSISVTVEKRLDLSRQQDVERESRGVSSDEPTNGSHRTETGLVDKATVVVVKKICLENQDSTFSMVEASINSNDAAKDSSNAGNKSRIITLPRASVVTPPSTTKSIPNRLLTPQSGKERYPDLDGDTQSRGNRYDLYTNGSKEFTKDRVHDLSLRNSRLGFMRGMGRDRGRGSGRFGARHYEWGSDNDFTTETYNGQSNYRVRRPKQHALSIDDADFDGYGTGPDGGNSSRRKRVNDDKFIRHLSDDIDPVYTRPQTSYEEIDGQPLRGNRNFPTMRRKDYPRSKSPVRSRTRSPGPWSSRRRRSPDGLQEINQHKSSSLYRMRKMRSPDRSCFREEMVSRRRRSPSYVTRHVNDARDGDSVPEHVHPRSINSNRRSPPAQDYSRTRDFPRTARRDVLDSRERGDEIIDERRKFIERRGSFHSFRPGYNESSDNFHFQVNDGPKPYRFCPDGDTQFVERREREFHGDKHQPLIESRRSRDLEDQDGNYRSGGRVWHDDGLNDVSGLKRRRF